MPTRKKTKIVATLGPATSKKEVLKEMILAGVDVFRINFSHAAYEDVTERIKMIRELNEELDINTAILADLQGPKLRVGVMGGEAIVAPGDEVTFVTGEPFEGTAERVYMNYQTFPKDVKAFIKTAQKHDVDMSILSSVDAFNEERIHKITNKFFSKANLKKGDQISLLGLSFKPNTDDVRDSTSLKIAKLLQDRSIVIKSYDPEAMDNAKKENTELQLCNSAYEACEDTKAIIIGTEWNEFRALDFLKIRGRSKNLVIFDLRNIYNAKEITDLGFQYFGTGK